MTGSETAEAGAWHEPGDDDAASALPEFGQEEALFGESDDAVDDADPAGSARSAAPAPYGTGASAPAPHRTGASTPATATTGAASAAPLALYRRYRPDTFADVIGQEHVTEPLQRALANNRVNHAYLFSGPRGCGKTTSARILARALNCEQGPRPEPCGECRSCQDLARGGPGSIDVIEIDAASHGGVDDARDLRERAFFAPVASRYKIYIVDEAHMVTTQGFNALLKLVEEPPPHVKFVFATTEPEKVIGTIRSRTHHYPFRLVPPKVLGDYLAHLCEAEGITVEPAVLPLVVRAGAGSVRDSLSVLDQLLGGANQDGVGYRHAAALLGYTPDSLLDEYLDAFAAGDAGGVFACVDKVIEVGQDPRRFAEDLLRRLRDLVIVAAVPDALTSGLVDVAADQAERLSSQAAALGPGELTRAAEVIAKGLTDMRGTTAPRLHLELMCARVLLPGADVDGRGLHARLDRIERRMGMLGTGGGPPSQQPAAAVPPTQAPVPVTQAPGTAEHLSSPATPSSPTSPGPRDGETGQPPAPATAPPDEPVPAPSEAPTATQGPAGGESDDTALGPHRTAPDAGGSGGRPSLTVTDVRRLWPEVLEEVKGRRRFTWILLSQNAQVVDVREGTLVLAMAGIGARDSFAKGGSENILKEALIEALGVDLRIEVIVDPSVPGGRGDPRTASSAAGPVASTRSNPSAPSTLEPAAGTGPANVARPSEPYAAAPVADDEAERPGALQRSGGVDVTGGGGSAAAGSSEAPGAAADPGWREQARQHIRPTRQGGSTPGTEAEDLRDEAVSLNDTDVDEGEESHTELLARQLGAEIIGEEAHDP